MSEPALSLIGDVGIEAIRAHSLGLTERVIARADDLRIEVLTPRGADERGGVVALRFRDDERVAKELVQRGYICSYRGALRVAPHFYNTDEEVDSFMNALAEIRSER
jgi:selenocysteine lyase/cysteine desulfurase